MKRKHFMRAALLSSVLIGLERPNVVPIESVHFVPKPKELTEADLSRIRAAEEKRERKAARKANQRAAKGEV